MFLVEFFVRCFNDSDILAKLSGRACADVFIEKRTCKIADGDDVVRDSGFIWGKKFQMFVEQIIHTLELNTDSDRPCERTCMDTEFTLKLVQERERIASFSV